MNKASHHGGAVSIRTSGNVLINQCNFESNEANLTQSTSKLLYNDFHELKTNGYGSSIYLIPTFTENDQDYTSKQITISGCSFTKNRAYQGYAIYIEGEESTTIYSITGNNFNNNFESSGSPATNGNIASEVLSLTKETIEGSNTFNNTEEGTQSEKFMRVDHREKLLIEGDFTYDDKNMSLIEPSERIEKEVHESSVNDVTVKVTVSSSTLSSKTNDDGGSIHIVNCALECTRTNFDVCKSPSGGGGAIYIENTGGTTNKADLVGLTFTGCEAEYGGAVYIYSNKIQKPVQISYCTFIGNKATSTSSDSNSKLIGGGTVFITAKKGDISSNIFRDNEGEGVKFSYHLTFMITSNYIESLKNLHECCLKFMDGSKKQENFLALKKIFDDINLYENKQENKLFFLLIVQISNDHHRKCNFFEKIEQIESLVK